jgi:hypothetical protein
MSLRKDFEAIVAPLDMGSASNPLLHGSDKPVTKIGHCLSLEINSWSSDTVGERIRYRISDWFSEMKEAAGEKVRREPEFRKFLELGEDCDDDELCDVVAESMVEMWLELKLSAEDFNYDDLETARG